MLAPGDRDADPVRTLPAAHRRRHAGGIERRDRVCGEGHVLSEQRPERAVVGLDLVGAELLGGGHEAHAPHVELLAHDLGQPFDRLPLAPVREHHHLGERLANLDVGAAARAQAEAHRLARVSHRLL